MNVEFADTFFWIALTNIQAHERAKVDARLTAPGAICTTEEVLGEYLNYFGGWGMKSRQKAALNGAAAFAPPGARSMLNGHQDGDSEQWQHHR